MTRTQRWAAFALLALIVVAAAVPAGAADKRAWEKFKYAPLGEIKIPPYQRVQLPSGLVLYLAEDHELPQIELSTTIRAGGIYESADKIGLAEVTGSVMRTGGTKSWSGDEIDQTLESMGAELETFIGDDTGGAYLSVLKEDFDKALAIYAEILASPRFDQEKIDLSKREQAAEISRRNDDPMGIARREFTRVVYGPDHPLARMKEYDTVNAITRDDLLKFHRSYVGPDRAWLVVIGDFDATPMKAKLEQALAGWAKAAAPLPPDPEMPEFPRTINVVDKSDLTQSTVILGHLGIRASDPNYAPIMVANRILGGGFASRLFVEVRSNRGYAYATGSAPGTGFHFPGVFTAFVGTKSGSTQDATQVILDQVQKMTTQPVTAGELAQAKDGILNSDVFNYDTKREVLDRLVTFEMYGYPADFLQKYRAAVQAVTADQVLAATKAVWHADRMAILAVGNPKDWDGDLSKFGPVTKVDITIPAPKSTFEIPAATPATVARGQEMMEKAATAVGGKALASMKSYHRKMNLAATIQGMSLNFGIDETAVLPDRLCAITTTPFGTMTQVVDGSTGWAQGPQGAKDLSAEDAVKAREQIDTELVRILRDHKTLTCVAMEPQQVDGRSLERVCVTGAGKDYIVYYLDPATGLPAIEETPGTSPVTQAPVVQKTLYQTYGDFAGLHLPKAMTILHDGEKFATGTLDKFELNPTIAPDTFKKK